MSRSPRDSDEMYPIMEAYSVSGQSQRTFCRERGIPVAVFGYWWGKYRRSRLVATPATTGFIEVPAEAVPTEKAHVEVLYPSGTRVRLFSAVTPAYVAGLVSEVNG